MDRKVATIRNAMSELEQLERAIGGDQIDTSEMLTRKM
jgi:hypothetical protein